MCPARVPLKGELVPNHTPARCCLPACRFCLPKLFGVPRERSGKGSLQPCSVFVFRSFCRPPPFERKASRASPESYYRVARKQNPILGRAPRGGRQIATAGGRARKKTRRPAREKNPKLARDKILKTNFGFVPLIPAIFRSFGLRANPPRVFFWRAALYVTLDL